MLYIDLINKNNYKKYKEILEAEKHKKLNNFTYKWYRVFVDCWRHSIKENTALYEPIFTTKFYIKNGCEYCRFLELFYKDSSLVEV